jgi:bifunctional DNA-binding transcriptional regulator/antitoxin component of YhaV-PrlF toxin-antitoxin module
VLPKEIRQRLALRPGDAVVMELSGLVLRCVKMPNPFDVLAEQAEEEHRTGKTRELRDVIRSTDSSGGR